jgi:hypothetical protein
MAIVHCNHCTYKQRNVGFLQKIHSTGGPETYDVCDNELNSRGSAMVHRPLKGRRSGEHVVVSIASATVSLEAERWTPVETGRIVSYLIVVTASTVAGR